MATAAQEDDMTEAARGIATDHVYRRDPDHEHTKRLVITGTQPTTVWVKGATDANNKSIATFALKPTDPFYPYDIEWQCQVGTETAMFLTFIFVPGAVTVTGLECALPYSPAFVSDSITQQLVSIPPAEYGVKWACEASFPEGPPHDPKIVVTPITDPGGGGGVRIKIDVA